jgi:NAD(P)-dependent dehydrogenase (short-subunit alcohol dehydrogenase family)
MRNLEHRPTFEEAMSKRGVTAEVLQLDITDLASIERAVEQVLERAGDIYGLINNAGIGMRGFFEDHTDSAIRDVFNTNVFGTMSMTRAVLPHMRAVGQGRIIIITSVGGRISSLGVSAYCSTKFAQEGFGEALYQELLPFGIFVSLIEPAIIKTERWGTNRGVSEWALNKESPYYEWFLNSERLADRLVETSPTTPTDVAKAVHKALSSARPRLRYMVGSRASLVMSIRRYLPATLFERLYFGEAIKRVTGSRRKSYKH